MKSIIALSLILLLSFVFVSTVSAQEKTPKTPEERAEALTDWMKTNLQISSDQEAPIKAINLKYANLTEELRNSSAARMQKFKTLKSNDQAKDKELKAILTDEQFKAYQAKKDELNAKFKEEMRERKNPS